MLLNSDFRDILLAFNGAEVEYMVVGAYALAAHGLPRATGDIDLFVRCSIFNAKKIMQALKAFGAPLAGISELDFLKPEIVLQIGVSPRRIDITTTIDGVTFDQAVKNQKMIEVDGVPFSIIGKNDLLINKKAAGRPKDLGDADWLENN